MAKRPGNTSAVRAKRQRLSPEVRREALIEAAKRCLKKRGSKGFNLQNVATEAKVSIGLIGHYFGGVEELLIAVFRSVMFEMPDLKRSKPQGLEEAVDDLRDMVARNFAGDYHTRENLLVWLPIYEEMLLNEKIRVLLNKTDEDYVEKVAVPIARVAELRGLSINARSVAYNFLALLDGLWIRWCHSKRKDPTYEQNAAYEYLEMVLGPIPRAGKA
jgi:AcrR family transcriptional regulator